jgi:hypothetical protein
MTGTAISRYDLLPELQLRPCLRKAGKTNQQRIDVFALLLFGNDVSDLCQTNQL